MFSRSLVAALGAPLAVALSLSVSLSTSACKDNPDPRSPSTSAVQKQSLGGWVVVTPRQGPKVMGELISIDAFNLALLTWSPVASGQRALHLIPIADIAKAELYRYESNDSNLGGWGILGTLSTISHGFFLALSAPVWVLSASIAGVSESRHVVLEYPESTMVELSVWARFPQGMPPGLDPRALVAPMPPPLPPPAVPPIAPPGPPAAAPPAPAPAAPPAPAPAAPPAPTR